MKTPRRLEHPLDITFTLGVGGLVLYVVYLAASDTSGGWGLFFGMLLIVVVGSPIALLLGVPLAVIKASDKRQHKFLPAKDAPIGRKIVMYGKLFVLIVLSAYLVMILLTLL